MTNQDQAAYLVAYDLEGQRDYRPVYRVLSGLGSSVRLQRSLWLICSNAEAIDIQEKLQEVCGPNANILVFRASEVQEQ